MARRLLILRTCTYLVQVLFFDHIFRQCFSAIRYIIYLSGDYMVIYVDTLVFTNIIIDYILLCITSVIVKRNYRLLRLISAAVIGGFSSLYIFFQTNFYMLDLFFKIGMGALIVFVAIGIKDKKIFIFSYIIFLFLSFVLNGAVYFLQNIMGNKVLLCDNLVNYIDISPLILIGLTILIYFAIRCIQRIGDRRINNDTACLKVNMCGITESYIALVDSGNHLSDPFGDAQVFVINNTAYEQLINKLKDVNIENRRRLIPVKTIENVGLLEALRCDSAEIIAEEKLYKYNKPIIAASKAPIGCGCEAIVSRSSLNRIPD